MPKKKQAPKNLEKFVSNPKRIVTTAPKRVLPEPAKRFEPPKKRFGRSYFILIIIIAMALSAAYLLIKGVDVTKESLSTPPTPVAEQEARQDYVDSIVESVKRHIVVNENEAPYVATISNIDLVRQKNPVFYKDASQGDKLVVWSDKAVIYSERLDKIVAVATAFPPAFAGATSTPGELGEEAADIESEGEISGGFLKAPEDTSVEIRNGSRVAGAAARLRTTLSDEGFVITDIGDAANTYEGTQIINLAGESADNVINVITDVVEGTVTSSIPGGEPESDANILIIIGR